MIVVVAVVTAGMLGALGPRALRALPEPAEPETGKPLYVDLAAPARLSLLLGAAAAVPAGLLATRLPASLLPTWVVFCGVGAWLAYVDARTRLLPFWWVAPLYVVSLALVATAAVVDGEPGRLVGAALGNVGVFGFFWLIHTLARLFDHDAFGYGDVRLSAVLGLDLGALGLAPTLVGVYAGFVLGSLGGLLLGRLGLVDRHGFAFGPYLVLGGVLGAGWGSALLG